MARAHQGASHPQGMSSHAGLQAPRSHRSTSIDGGKWTSSEASSSSGINSSPRRLREYLSAWKLECSVCRFPTLTPPITTQVPPSEPLPPIVENPFGVHDHDILCGRGAFVNGHIGNQRLRTLAQERKIAFDAGNYTEKRSLANEIVTILKALDPPGRFLKRASKKGDDEAIKKEESKEAESEWEELGDEKAIHKACQVMRDIDRPDRKDREERRLKKKQKVMEKKLDKVDDKNDERRKKGEEEAVSEAVAATEEALDKALDAADSKTKEEISKAGEDAVEV
jgi:hypothetical protein